MNRRALVGALLCLMLLALTPALDARAQTTPPTAAMGQENASGGDRWFLTPKIKRLFRSHTSYQFGNPYQAQLNPLSRLEFPLNSWWGGVNFGVEGPRYRLELEFLASLPGQDDIGVMRDSDWEDEQRPKVTTIYSETTAELKESFMLDGKFSFSLREEVSAPCWLDLRPLVGVRWQKFVFVTRDGVQQNMDDDGQWRFQPLTGETIWFRQQYVHAYAGLMLTADLARLGLGQPGRGWRASLQADLAHVWGENRDRHLLRGNRVTTERTQGYAWHAALSLRAPLGDWGALVMSADYMYIYTSGEHTLDHPEYDIDYTFDYGVKVWSQQMGISLALEIPF